jgi:hypothetical protein
MNTLALHVLRATPFYIYHIFKILDIEIYKINMKIIFQEIKQNLHNSCVIFLLTSIACCIYTNLFYNDMMSL